MTKLGIMTDENTTSQQTQPTEAATEAAAETATDTDAQQQDQGAQSAAESAAPVDFEPLTATYERLRHSTDPAELSEFARRPLPDRADQAAFSRATALLEAVAGNPHTPVADRVFLADTMPFPNVLVKLSEDPDRASSRGRQRGRQELAGRPSDQGSGACGPGYGVEKQAHQLEDAA